MGRQPEEEEEDIDLPISHASSFSPSRADAAEEVRGDN